MKRSTLMLMKSSTWMLIAIFIASIIDIYMYYGFMAMLIIIGIELFCLLMAL